MGSGRPPLYPYKRKRMQKATHILLLIWEEFSTFSPIKKLLEIPRVFRPHPRIANLEITILNFDLSKHVDLCFHFLSRQWKNFKGFSSTFSLPVYTLLNQCALIYTSQPYNIPVAVIWSLGLGLFVHEFAPLFCLSSFHWEKWSKWCRQILSRLEINKSVDVYSFGI